MVQKVEFSLNGSSLKESTQNEILKGFEKVVLSKLQELEWEECLRIKKYAEGDIHGLLLETDTPFISAQSVGSNHNNLLLLFDEKFPNFEIEELFTNPKKSLSFFREHKVLTNNDIMTLESFMRSKDYLKTYKAILQDSKKVLKSFSKLLDGDEDFVFLTKAQKTLAKDITLLVINDSDDKKYEDFNREFLALNKKALEIEQNSANSYCLSLLSMVSSSRSLAQGYNGTNTTVMKSPIEAYRTDCAVYKFTYNYHYNNALKDNPNPTEVEKYFAETNAIRVAVPAAVYASHNELLKG